MPSPELRTCVAADAADLAGLFDAYRQFYRKAPDLEGAREFLSERLTRKESTVIGAYKDSAPVGFVQCYPLYSSVQMAPAWLLNDLFVQDSDRGQGIGKLLLDAAADAAIQAGAVFIMLETETTNTRARDLYERERYRPDTDVVHYTRPLSQVR